MDQQPPTAPGASDAPATSLPVPPSASAAPPTAAPSAWVVAQAPTGRGSVTGLAKLGAFVLVLGGLFWTAIGALLLLAAGSPGPSSSRSTWRASATCASRTSRVG